MKTLTAAVFSTLLCSSSYAAGLGKLTVLSSLGQPLHAEIELTSVSKDEGGGVLVAKLASTDAYKDANIDFNPILFSLRFSIEQKGQRQFINVTSTQPVNEPFVDMLLELGGTGSKLVREYTFLLDPADLRMKQSVQVAAPAIPVTSTAPVAQSIKQPEPVVVQQPAAESKPASQPMAIKPAEEAKPVEAKPPVAESKPAEEKKPAAETKPAKAEKAAKSASVAKTGSNKEEKNSLVYGDYQVKKGDSLAKIANQFKPEGVSLDQMLVALYRDNPKAFEGKNMNRLRAGEIISIPDAPVALDVTDKVAKGVVLAQAADFSKYRSKLAAHVAEAAAQKSSDGKQSSTGKITAKVEEQKNVANESKDKLKLSKAGTPANGAAGNGKTPANAVASEDAIAKNKALADANARIKELEKNVADLTALNIKNKELAEQQKQAELAKSAVAAKAAAAAAATPTPAVAAKPASSAAVASVPTPASTVTPAPATVKPVESDANKQAAASAAASAPVVVPPKPIAPPVVKAPVAPAVPETSFIDDLLGNTILLSSIGGLLLVGLGAFAINSARRKKQNKQFEDSTITDSSLKANSLFGSTGGQSVDTNNSVFNSNFAPSASQLDTNEVDPVAEADVYIAYGRDAQAEEILKEALRTQPERNAVRVKLLEIYANRKDTRAFEILATELYSMTKGEGDDWSQAASLGAGIDPANPLYASGKLGETTSAPSSTVKMQAEPLEELDLDDLLNSTQSQVSVQSHDVDVPLIEEEAPTLDLSDDAAADHGDTHAESKATANTLDFDLAGMGLTQELKAPKPSNDDAPLDLNIGALDFGLPHHDAVAASNDGFAESEEAGASLNLGSTDFSLDADFPSMTEKSNGSTHANESAPMDLDLSGISLDLNPAAASNSADINLDLNVAETDLNGEYHADSEMATKLDLAIAYQEIGDKDGARELLDEVIKGGSSEQSEKAKSMLVRLA
ncbi:MAG TPA: FimV/HubP family polar landmark protein [Burkholderiaceae bacterium]